MFAKPYFDREGLIVALDDAKRVGFVLTGFGPSGDGARLDTASGVVNLLAVIPAYRKKGVGAELASRAEDYLRGRGARTLYAGPMEPFNPFTFGLYGGSGSPGFLDSDAAARPFFEKRGYKPDETALVFQRPLDRPPVVADARFAAFRQHYDIQVGPRTGTTWWQECVFGPLELHDYRLVGEDDGQVGRPRLAVGDGNLRPDVERARRRRGRAGNDPGNAPQGIVQVPDGADPAPFA